MSTVLITGCNRGIGLELCHQFLARGDDVIAVCRQASDKLRDSGATVIDGIDVSQGDSVARLKVALDGKPIDVLVNNAGILRPDTFGEIDYLSLIHI